MVVFSTASFILDSIPQVDWLHPYLITHNWPAFGDLFRDPIAWNGVGQGLYVAAAYAVVFFLAAWARFAGKDVTSWQVQPGNRSRARSPSDARQWTGERPPSQAAAARRPGWRRCRWGTPAATRSGSASGSAASPPRP